MSLPIRETVVIDGGGDGGGDNDSDGGGDSGGDDEGAAANVM